VPLSYQTAQTTFAARGNKDLSSSSLPSETIKTFHNLEHLISLCDALRVNENKLTNLTSIVSYFQEEAIQSPLT
jgi:hypothetical protein